MRLRTAFASSMLLTISTALPAAQADVRVVHASPDAPNVDVIVNDNFATPAFSNAPFRGVTPYATLPSGTYNFKVVPSGTTAPVVIDATLPLDAALDYTIAATGVLASIAPAVYQDDNTLSSTQARLRFIHLSPNAPAVSINVAGGGPSLFSDVEFRENGGYVSVAPGTYDLDVRLFNGGGLVLSVPGVALAANTVYTVYATGLVGSTSTPLSAVLSVDAIPEPGTLTLLGLGAMLALRRRA